MRAKAENSLTRCFRSSTSLMIVRVHSSSSAAYCLGRRAQLAAQALGRELDRRQRVLDLVRDPARHLAPRFHPLDLGHLADVLEKQHRAQIAVADRPSSASTPSVLAVIISSVSPPLIVEL